MTEHRPSPNIGSALEETTGGPRHCLGGDDAFLERTIALFQSRSEKRLTKEDARQIVENVTGFFRVLNEWDRAKKANKKPGGS